MNTIGMFSDPQLPVLYFPEENWKKLFAYADIASGEISGLGKIMLHENETDFIVNNIFLLEQVSGVGSTDLNSDSVAKFITDLIIAGEDPANLKLWFHSHGYSDVFWSSTDNITIQGFSDASYMLSIVVNKHFQHKARLDLFQPIRLTLELKVMLENNFLGIDRVEIEKEVKQKVKILSSPANSVAKPISNILNPRKKR